MFREIPETNGFYSVSDDGIVRSNDRIVFNNGSKRYTTLKGKVLKQYINNKGYCYVDLMVDGKKDRQLVHRLVAKTFISNPDNLPIINHLDSDPTNNSVDNLEWCDYSYNNKYGYSCGNHLLTEKFYESVKSPKPYLWKPVVALDKDDLSEVKRYNSVSEAANDIIDRFSHDSPFSSVKTNISTAAKDNTKTSYGFKWKYIR